MDMTLLDGGAGTDTISFEESTVASGTTLNLTTGGATNFENLTGSASIETLNGDANANTISGKGGTDTIYGNGGNDILYGYANDGMDGGASSQSGDDVLYGGSGDDQLYGTAGENILDGGTGKDTMYGGNGADTFVLRAGDGNSTLANANVIADFQNGTDVFALEEGLTYNSLTISQGTGANISHTIVKYGSEYLAIIQNTSVSNITASDFVLNVAGLSPNNAPVVGKVTPLSINEDNISGSISLNATDVDSDSIVNYIINRLPEHGVLFVDSDGNGVQDAGEASIALNGFVSQADITANKLKFNPTADYEGKDNFG
jgi:Ca2+-binding RTX toxin-like protein